MFCGIRLVVFDKLPIDQDRNMHQKRLLTQTKIRLRRGDGNDSLPVDDKFV